MRTSKRAILLARTGAAVMVTALLLSCSTTPRRPAEINVQKNRAAELTETGRRLMKEGKYDEALVFYNRALDLNLQVDHEQGIVRSYNDIAVLNLVVGRLDEAKELIDEALRAARRMNDPMLTAVSLSNAGQMYIARGNIEAADKSLAEALELAGGRDTREKALICHNLATVRKAQADYEEAMSLYLRAAEINEKERLYEELASNYYMIASVYSKRELYPTAMEFAYRALDLDKRMENGPGIGKDYLALALISEKAGNTAQAYQYFRKSFQVYRALGFADQTARLLAFLAKTADALGELDQAAAYRDAAATLSEAR